MSTAGIEQTFPKFTFSPKQAKFITSPFDHTLEVNEGTPRSGKTTAGHFRYAYYLINTPDINHLITAYNQEQAYRLFIDGDGTGLLHIFGDLCRPKTDKKLGDYLEVHTPTGIKKVFYKGGGKADSVKAITGMSLGSVVFCEINLLHMGMIQECFRRTFAAKMRYHLADLNPPAPSHPVIKEVFEVQNTKWTHWTIHDNPIITPERKEEIRQTLSKNTYLYQRDWEGKRVLPEGIIYSMFSYDRNKKTSIVGRPVEMFFSGDGGQSDATTISCNVVSYDDANKRYVLNRIANYYHSGKETGQTKAMSTYAKEIASKFVPYCLKKTNMSYVEFFVDPACKSLREELLLNGIDTTGADNNARDVSGKVKGIEVGIERAQNLIENGQFVIVETDEYDHYHFEQELGSYVRDNNGTPIDDNNHAMDEFRYSVNYFYKNYVL